MARKSGKYIAATARDIAHLAAHLRQSDINEMTAKHGDNVDVLEVIRMSIFLTPNAKIRVSDTTGEAIAALGIAPLDSHKGIGLPWMVGTDAVGEYPAAFIIEGREFVERGLHHFKMLENYVDARNLKSISWLRKIGFTIHPAEPFGEKGELFHRFTAVRVEPPKWRTIN